MIASDLLVYSFFSVYGSIIYSNSKLKAVCEQDNGSFRFGVRENSRSMVGRNAIEKCRVVRKFAK